MSVQPEPLGCKCPHCHGVKTQQVCLFDAAGEREWLAECLECKAMGRIDDWHSPATSHPLVLLSDDQLLFRLANEKRELYLATQSGTTECKNAQQEFRRAWARCSYMLPCLADRDSRRRASQTTREAAA